MNNVRHIFKQDNTNKKLDFISNLFDFINNLECSIDNKNVFYDIVEYFANNKDNISYSVMEEVLKSIFTRNCDNNCDYNILINDINNYLNPIMDQISILNHNKFKNGDGYSLNVENELNQISKQSNEIIDESISIINKREIISRINKEDINKDDIDEEIMVEVIDLDKDIDKYQKNDVNINNNVICYFCNGNNIMILSHADGYCFDCDRKFFIIDNKQNKYLINN